jgi:signal transduction histidine kinase
VEVAIVVLALVLLLAALVALAIRLLRLQAERRAVRGLVGAEPGVPTPVALRRVLRQSVHRDELSAALFSREALLDAVPSPVLVVDRGLRVRRVNAAAESALGPVAPGDAVEGVSPELAHAVRSALDGPPIARAEVAAGREERIFAAEVRAYTDGASRSAVAVLVDATESVDYREARRGFSAAVSHELRTPLQRIRGLVETLALPLSEAERGELVGFVEDEVERMRELIDEMLLLAALDRGQVPLPAGECDAGEVAAHAVEARRERAEAAGMTLDLTASRDLQVAVAPRLLEVVVGNVVDNALHHAGRPAAVHVEVRGRAGEVAITVRDTGVGIPRDQLPHVFERFFRGETSRSTPGSGLGLAIVQHIVEAHGGRVAIDSRRGEGTDVRLVFPEAPLSGREVSERDEEGVFLERETGM